MIGILRMTRRVSAGGCGLTNPPRMSRLRAGEPSPHPESPWFQLQGCVACGWDGVGRCRRGVDGREPTWWKKQHVRGAERGVGIGLTSEEWVALRETTTVKFAV
jgi:hypothetical protein